MPPEPLPWDRKDFVFKDRKQHDRVGYSDALASSVGGGNSTPRWRDPCHFARASPRRLPPGYHRQTVSYYQLYEESNGHGCTPSRSDDSFRSSSGRYNGGRSSSRDSRGSLRRSPYHEMSHVTPRSVAASITSPRVQDFHDKSGGGGDGDDQRSDRDRDRDRDHSLGSIGWKPLKWSRQGSSSGLGSNSKAIRSETEETTGIGIGLEVSVPNLGKETPVRSPVSSPMVSDDAVTKKKPRLTWGQGLAKYEKQKVDGTANSGRDQVSETSPKVTGMAGSMSPATPCSAARSSSPGIEDRPFTKIANVDNDTSHHSYSSTLGPQNCSSILDTQNCSEEPSIKLEHMYSICTLNSLLTDLLQPEDACCGDSTFSRSTTNKLQLFKDDISKELEKTECEIDLLENQLKSLNCDEKSDPCQSTVTLQADSSLVPCQDSSSVPCQGLAEGSLNFTPVVSSAITAITVIEEPILQICSSIRHEAEVKDANDDIGKSTSSGNVITDPKPLYIGVGALTENGTRDENHLDGGSSGSKANLDVSSHGKADNNLVDLIMASNRDSAKRASQVFDEALPTAQQQFDIWGSDRILSCRKNDLHIKEKLSLHKHQLKFKERVLALKFRAFHHLWKEDLRLLSLKKQRPKSQKRFELSSRSSQSSLQKHRSSIRSRFTLPAGNLTLVPTADIVDFTNKLLSDSQIKLYRNNLKMPALILDEKERRCSRFITNNGLIEDPLSFEKERSMINPWTQEEKVIFMEMLATFGKDFSKISSFLKHKNTADCIELYYKNHKSESFRDVKKQLDLRKQWRCLPTNTYLVTSGKKWSREANAASLDMQGGVSLAAAHNPGNGRQKYAGKSVHPGYHSSKVSCGSYGSIERVSSVEHFVYEKETAAADVLAGIFGAERSSEAVSSCVTSSISPPEKMNYMMVERPLTPEVTQTIEEEDTCSDEGCGEPDSVDWTDEEKSMFIRALSMFGKDFARISCCVGAKSRDQCKIFFSKARKCLGLDLIHPGAGNGGTPFSDTNGGRSDTDDALVAEMDSAICSTQSCSKMDVDFTQSTANTSIEGFVHAGNTSLQTKTDRSSEQYEVGGSTQEEIEVKVDGLVSVLKVVKLESEGGNLQSDKDLDEIGDVALKCNELVPSEDGAELSVKRELDKVENDHGVSPAEPATATCIKDKQLKPHNAAEVKQKVISGGLSADGVKREDKQLKPHNAAEVKQEVISGGLSADEVKSEAELQRGLLVSGTGSAERQWKKIDTEKSNSVNLSFAAESFANGNASYKTTKMNACPNPSFNFTTSRQHQVQRELLSCLPKKSKVMSSKQDNTYPVPLSTVLPDPSSIFSEGSLLLPSHSTLNFEEHLNKLHQGSAARDFYQQYLLRTQNQIDQSLHILSGYPVQMLNQKELRREANLICEKPILLESHSKANVSSQSKRDFVDIKSEKRDSSMVSNSRPGILFPPRIDEVSDSQLRSCSQNTSQETEQQSTHRTGDVKLFGQILSNPSSQKSNSSLLESDCQRHFPKQKKPATVKSSSSRSDSNSSVYPCRTESNGQSGLEEVPLTSYGYWDGSRIQTGLSSLPESAIAPADYQGSVAGMSFHLAKDGSVSHTNGGVPNYQPAFVQPLSANGKRLDSFSELQKKNGFEMVSGFPQQGRAMARLGVTIGGGSRGILVGGSGVSDPVAALNMATKFYTGEVESWTRDLGSR